MRHSLLVATLLWSTLSAFGQADSALVRIQQYLRGIHTFNQAYPQEKVYLHLDNRSYFVGDTIWFKAYVVNAATLKATDVSKILYVELLNDKGVEMETKKLRIENGQCYGEFALKDSYYTGYYELRAYTRYMMNFGNESLTLFDFMDKYERASSLLSEREARQDLVPDINYCQFTRTVPVYSRPDTIGQYKREFEYYPMHTRLAIPDETDPKLREDDLQVRFYPEGGSLVEGVPSVVAIEANDQWGREKQVAGTLLHRNGQIGSFATGRRGRTLIQLTPAEDESLNAQVEYKGKVYTFALPKAQKEGCVLSVKPTTDYTGYEVTISASPSLPDELFGWSLQCRGALTAFDTLTVGSGRRIRMKLDKQVLHPGVNQFTLFNAEGRILADRLFFVQPPTDTPALRVELPTDSLNPFEEVEVGLQIQNSWGGGTRGFLSVSVTDADEEAPTFDKGDIRTELLLTSDLKGFIKDVDSYFTHSSMRAMHMDIDLLMLTQGWRRYEWKTMVEGTRVRPRYTPEKGYVIDGYVADQLVDEKYKWNADEYKRIENPWVTIALKSDQVDYRDTVQADGRGEFSFDIPRHFTDDAGLSIEIWKPDGLGKKKRKGKYRYVFPSLYRAFSPAPTPYDYYEHHSPEDDYELQVLENVDFAMEGLLDEVTIKRRDKQKHEIHYDRPDIVVDFVKEFNTIIDRGLHALTDPPPLKGYYDPAIPYTLSRARIPDQLRFIFVEGQNATKDSLTYAYYGKYLMQESDSRELAGDVSNGEYIIPDAPADDAFSEVREYLNLYQLPKEIRIYSNLVSREHHPVKQDVGTDHRRLLWAHTVYFPKGESPDAPPYDMRDGTRHTTFQGYSRVAEYYHRDYSETAMPDTVDYRRTLYWNPDVETDHQGRFTLKFYNNTRTKRIAVQAEGITTFGDPVAVRKVQCGR